MARDNRSPFISTVSSSLTFTGGGTFSGALTQFDTSRLINVWRVPIEVHEFRVMIETIGESTIIAGDTAVVATPVVHLEAKFGKNYLTDGPVPVSVLAPHRIADDGILPGDRFEADNTGKFERVSQRRIIFPKPIVVLPGKGFSAVASIPISPFMTTTLFNTNFVANVHLTMVGRFMSPTDRIPATNQVPIISHVELTQAKRTSLEDELRNPLSSKIKVHRVVGVQVRSTPRDLRMWYASNGASLAETTAIELRFPDGVAMSELPAEFPRIFGQCRVWPVTFDMDLNARIRAQITANVVEATIPFYGYQIALFGTREESV